MKKFFAILSCLVLLFAFACPVSAAVLTDVRAADHIATAELTGFIPPGYAYYLCHRWAGNGDYYLAFFSGAPVVTADLYPESAGDYYHIVSADGRNPLYYRFNNYDNMLAYLVNNDAADFTYVYQRTTIPYLRLNPTAADMYYANFDVIFDDTDVVYYTRNAYSITTTTTVVGEATYFAGIFAADDLVVAVLSDVVAVLPVCLVVLAGFIALRKAIIFVIMLLRGC